MASRIDTHHHALPRFYRDWLTGRGADAKAWPKWTPEGSKRHLKVIGAQTALLSVVPQPDAPRSDARALARDLNSALSELMVAEPATFGFFATLPLPDLESALDELDHAYGSLAADGVCLPANHEGVYLGDPFYEPLMRELDARASVVFVHPARLPGPAVPGLEPTAADALLDTTRAALNLARLGVVSRYPNIRFLLAHGGGFLPFAAGRLAASASAKNNPIDGLRTLRRFYFDTAQSGTPWAMPSLLKFAPRGHVTFGSDFPFAPTVSSVASAGYLTVARHRGGSSVSHGAAQRLFPRLVPVVPAIDIPDADGVRALRRGSGPRELR